MLHETTRRPTRPATAEDFHRLADLAETRGLEVIIDAQGRHFVTSHSAPFALHAVTGFSCDCKGFLSVGRCTHHSLLLRVLEWLPEVEPDMPFIEEAPATSTDCRECSGCGVTDHGHYTLPCETCGGTGRRPALPAPASLPVAEPAAAVAA